MRIVLALLVLAVIAAPAAAAPPWSEPRDLSGEHSFAEVQGVAYTGAGAAVVSWTRDGGRSVAVREAGAGAFGAQRRLRPDAYGPVLAYAADRTIVALLRGREPGRDRLGVAFGRAGAAFGRGRFVRRAERIGAPRLAVNARGDAALAWYEDRGTANDRVYVALRRAGRGFGRPRRLATGRIRSVSVAVGPRGDVLVAWDARGVVRARFKHHRRSRFGRVDTIRSEAAFSARLRTAVSAQGRAYVAWGAQRRSEGGNAGPVFFQAAVRPSGAARFRGAQVLEREDSGFDPRVALALDGLGRPVVAWAGVEAAGDRRVRVATTADDLLFRTGRTISAAAPFAQVEALVSSRAGDLLAVWTAGAADAPERVLAARQPASGGFGAPEEVAGPRAVAPAAALDPATGRATVAFSRLSVTGPGAHVQVADR